MADVLEDLSVDLKIDTTDGNHDKFAHYVKKEDIILANTEGKAVYSLCGKLWVPLDDPMKYPVCPECRDLHAAIPE